MNVESNENQEATDFLFRSPFKPEQQAAAIQNSLASIHRDLEYIKLHGFEEFTKHRAGDMEEEKSIAAEEENLGTAFEGTLRDYQIFMLERAKRENTIVHLGTGMGKTLISIMLMKEFLTRKDRVEKKQILFLVPSIALAVQHTDSFKANLPCKVETACHTSSSSARAREDIAVADVVVATHGAAKDLLTHYPDVMCLEKVSLMVMDECHYATGNHNYATILEKFYHPLPKNKRPRILGLTASPLINVSVRTNAEQLQSLLTNFENIMDARLVGFPSSDEKGCSSRSDVEQAVVKYQSSENISLPNDSKWGLHVSRKKELKQLQILCNDVGPRVTAVYAATLAREVSRNEFEQETQNQCDSLKSYLLHVANYLNEHIATGRCGLNGHTDKMRKLESLLKTVLSSDNRLNEQSPVGIVFVEMRITAIALSNYFSSTQNQSLVYNDTEIDSCIESDSHEDDDIFADAENDTSMDFRTDIRGTANSTPQISTRSSIRCDVAVRKANHIFKYLSNKKSLDERQQQDLEDDWVHQTTQIRTIISKLRNRETNLLFATSIVEEGVDVEACSFVISFDAIKTVKSYIQMKGRARQKNAKFFVFADNNLSSQPLSLNNALAVENMVQQFITHREEEYTHAYSSSSDSLYGCSDLECAEEKAMQREEYKTSLASVDLSSSKSLLNRYALSVPIDPSCRTSKQAILLHMPRYKDHSLTLPTHIPPDSRVITLPSLFQSLPRKKKHSLMALAACVRLHRLALLNDRLLPLSGADMKKWLIEHALNDLPPCKSIPSEAFKRPYKVHLYKISQCGEIFSQEEMSLSSDNRRVSLALALPSPLPDSILPMFFDHCELGRIQCCLVSHGSEELSDYQWEMLTDFHCVVFNARWRRKSKPKWFCFDDQLLSKHSNPYVVGCLDDNNKLNWDYIGNILDEFSRSIDERKLVVQECGNVMTSPRIWCPTYNPNAAYIVYGDSGKSCQCDFATSEYKSFKQYYADKYSLKVNQDGRMYKAKRIWEFPSTSRDATRMKEIPVVDIPQELCIESNVADPLLILHTIILPQFLYKLERYRMTASFIGHLLNSYPVIGKCLSALPLELITEALTAKSCSEEVSYDRLEWLGDAVLKLIHTDALLKWKRTSYLHEGYLTLLRSAMGSNDRLHECAKVTGVSDFILLTSLGRSEWRPCGLCCINEKTGEKYDHIQTMHPSQKVCADVVESLLGLVYIRCGKDDAMRVASELGISFTFGNADADPENRTWSETSVDPSLIKFATSFLGVRGFQSPQLLIEAITHQSCLHKPVPSYQRLEWIGDAVLCLSIRDWLFRFDVKLTVPRLVVLETTLECNESLAFLGLKSGLCQFIDHRDSRLPNRFETFQRDLDTMGRGLWSTDPPKIIPDVVEALIGAVHVDLGFDQGQNAALHVLDPIIRSISSMCSTSLPSDFSLWSLQGILHPKQHLFEMTSGIVRVRAYKNDRFNRPRVSSFSVEDNKDLNGYVGVITCKGLVISAVQESSKRAAINVACSLAVEILIRNPSLLEKLQDMHLISMM